MDVAAQQTEYLLVMVCSLQHPLRRLWTASVEALEAGQDPKYVAGGRAAHVVRARRGVVYGMHR